MSAETSPNYYVKIWGILLVLLVISIVGPMFEIKFVTLVTAFGIAIVKAYIVASKFMHLNIEKKYVSYMLLSMILMMALFFAGTAPDAMMSKGTNWEKAPETIQSTPSPAGQEHNHNH